MAAKRRFQNLVDKVKARGDGHDRAYARAVDPECPEIRSDSRPLTVALLSVLRALDPLARDERQRVLLAAGDLLALDRPGDAP